MGIRMDQFMGLNDWACSFVQGEKVFAYTEQVTRVYPDGREERMPDKLVYKSSVHSEPSGHYTGMFDQEHGLTKYTFPDGKVYQEAVQADPWSSGPVFFLALKDENGNWVPESLWSDEAISNA